MTKTIDLHPQAKKDLREIVEYIAEDNPSAALRFLDATKKSFLKIKEIPRMGCPFRIDHPDLQDIRVSPVSGFERFLVFYRPSENGIEVIHILHSARDIPTLFEDEFRDPL